MVFNTFLLLVLGFYLLLAVLVLIFRKLRSGIVMVFSLISWLCLLVAGLFSQLKLYTNPMEVEIINYSGNKGELYFLQGEQCDAPILYDFSVNANEESSMEVDGAGGMFSSVLFQTADGRLLEFPINKEAPQQLDIWEKELQPADGCFREQVQAYRMEQIQFSIAIGLLIVGGTLLMLSGRPMRGTGN